MHSGWARTLACGWRSFSSTSLRSENISWTMQLPGQSRISRPVFLMRKRPRCWSGANRMGCSGGIWRMIFSALLEVQMISLSAFTSALQLM